MLLVLLAFVGTAGAQERTPIADVVYRIVQEEGVEEAIATYHDLRANEGDVYDFGEDQLNKLGYRLLEENQHDAAVAVLKLNAEVYPASVNVYDSLAEAYLRSGRYEAAIPLYRKVLDMLPEANLPPNVKNFYRRNAEKNLFIAEHFDPPSEETLHYVAFFGGVPAGRWDMENILRFREAHTDLQISYEGHNLYGNPVPQAVAASLETEPIADVSTSFLGGMYRTWVEDGTIADISDLWEDQGWHEAFPKPFQRMATYAGRPYFVPLAFQWNPIFYRKDLFETLELQPPETWDDLLVLCGTIEEKGYTPFAISVKGWTPPVARWFTILNLRLNGPAFHEQVVRGEIPFTDVGVRSVFEHWQQLFVHGCFADNSAESTYRDGVQDIVEGEALMYNLGEWLYESLPDGYDKLDFFAFPTLDPEVPHAEIVHVYGAFMRAGTNHAEQARQLLAYLGNETSQRSNVETLGRISSNTRIDPSRYTEVQRRALDFVSEEVAVFVPLLEFNMPPAMAEATLEALVTFWEQPDDLDGVLRRLEEARRQVYVDP